jgi:phage tail sheath gpL-like
MALTSIIDVSNKNPGAYLKVVLGAGISSAGAMLYKVLLTGNKLAAGSAVLNQPYLITDEDQAKTLFGQGSELHRMIRAFLKKSKYGLFYAMATIESVGVKASGTLVFASNASSSGSVRVHIGDYTVEVPVASGDTPTTVAAAVSAAITAHSDAPATSAPSVGTVTVTAKQNGLRGNFIYLWAEMVGVGTMTVTPPAARYLTAGATADDPQTMLDALAGADRFHLIVAPFSDSTQLAKYKTSINTFADPVTAKRGRVVFGSLDTLANTITLATTLNEPRMQCGWHYNGRNTPAELASVLAADLQLAYSSNRAANTDGDVLTGLLPQDVVADRPITSEILSALNNGITPFGVNGTDVTLIRSITCRSRDSANNASYTVLDSHKVEVPDYVADLLQSGWLSTFKGFKLGVDIEGEVPPPGVATADSTKSWAASVIEPLDNDLIENFATTTLPGMIFERDGSADGRVNARIPLDVIEHFHQFAGEIRQVG